MESMKTMLSRGKDLAISASLKIIAKKHLERFGNLLDLHLDSARKTLDVTMHLNGEDTPITLHLEDYAITRDGGKAAITIGNLRASREWIEQVARDYCIGRSFELPEKYAQIIEKCI